MIRLLKEQGRWNELLFLGFSSMICFVLSVFRVLYTDTSFFLFLNWNLFLAFIPWALSSIAIVKPKLQNRKSTILILLAAWFLFFPNAPYILTDLFHLRIKSSMPIWFDLVLILSFAWTGLVFGFLSLWNIERILERSVRRSFIPVISSGLLFLGSFGIYVGRYLRWNSWDIIRNPFGLLYDIGDRFINPADHPRTWGMTIFMGLFLNMVYWSFRIIKRRNENNQRLVTSGIPHPRKQKSFL
jgi:uncharacterized membrane protein